MAIEDMIQEIAEELRFATHIDYFKSLAILVVDAFLFSISTLIGSAKFLTFTKLGFRVAGRPPMIVTAVVFSTVFVGGIIAGYIFNFVMNILGGSGRPLEGISVIAYSLLPISIGTLSASTASYVPFIGSILTFLLIFSFGSLGYAVLYRSTKEFFEVNMLKAFIGVSLLIAASTGALYASFLASVSEVPTVRMDVILQFIKP